MTAATDIVLFNLILTSACQALCIQRYCW